MSAYMLDDDVLMDAINPFVMYDVSLPGGVRKTGNFADFKEVQKQKNLWTPVKSPYCDFGLCRDEIEPLILERGVHPRRNIDTGFTCLPKTKTGGTTGVRADVNVSGTMMILILLFIVLALLFSRR